MILNAISQKAQIMDAFGIKDMTTQDMLDGIEDWYGLYYDSDQADEEDSMQRLAYVIVNKLVKTTFSEYSVTTKKKADAFCQAVIQAINKIKKEAMQQMLIGGEAWLKPYPTKTGWGVSVLRRDKVLIFGRDGEGTPMDMGSLETTTSDTHYYTLLERRTVDANGYLTITNKLYQSERADDLGWQVPLKSHPKYADFQDTYTFKTPLNGLGLAYIKTPSANCIDGSPDGVSVYAPAVDLIHAINHNEWLTGIEYDNARSRIFASSDLLKSKGAGSKEFKGTLYVALDGDPQEAGVTIFSPAIRNESFEARKQSYLRSIESIIGLKRGLLSEVEAVERTATEITSSEGDYSLSIEDLQEVWTAAVKETVRICGVLGTLYSVQGAHETDSDEVIVDYGNGILYDEDKTWAEYMDLVARGMLKPEIALGWKFGMPTETEQDLAAIRAKYMPVTQLEGGDE